VISLNLCSWPPFSLTGGLATITQLDLWHRQIRKRIAAFWRWDRRAGRKRFILEVERLPAIDGRETCAIDNHVTSFDNEALGVLLRPWHPQTLIGSKKRPLHLLHRRRRLSS
jgi:hypothetical protein